VSEVIEHLKDLTDRILDRTLSGRDLFNSYPEIHRELEGLTPEQFDASKQCDFMLARAAFAHLVKPNKHESITGSMVYKAAKKLRPVLDHYVGAAPIAYPEQEPDDEGQAASHEAGGGDASHDATREYLVKVANLKGMLNERARGGSPSEHEYSRLRDELVAIPAIRDILPNFVLRCRTIQEFWQFIKPKYAKWHERTEFLQEEFEPILSWLEGGTKPPIRNGHKEPGRPARMIKVLLLSANPIDSPLNIDEEFRAIDQKIRSSEHRDHVDLVKHGAVRLEDVAGLLMRHKPHIVHFSGHGAASGIALTGADGQGRLVPPDALANIFRTLKDNVRVVLLNACDSAPQAEAIVSEIDCAVGMSDEIDAAAAIAFAAAFYEVLGYGRSVQDAYDLALVQLEGAGAARSLAKLHKRRTVKPSEIILIKPPRPQ
jgi:hypothetical protein